MILCIIRVGNESESESVGESVGDCESECVLAGWLAG
mgnify:CR=1 FL=1